MSKIISTRATEEADNAEGGKGHRIVAGLTQGYNPQRSSLPATTQACEIDEQTLIAEVYPLIKSLEKEMTTTIRNLQTEVLNVHRICNSVRGNLCLTGDHPEPTEAELVKMEEQQYLLLDAVNTLLKAVDMFEVDYANWMQNLFAHLKLKWSSEIKQYTNYCRRMEQCLIKRFKAEIQFICPPPAETTRSVTGRLKISPKGCMPEHKYYRRKQNEHQRMPVPQREKTREHQEFYFDGQQGGQMNSSAAEEFLKTAIASVGPVINISAKDMKKWPKSYMAEGLVDNHKHIHCMDSPADALDQMYGQLATTNPQQIQSATNHLAALGMWTSFPYATPGKSSRPPKRLLLLLEKQLAECAVFHYLTSEHFSRLSVLADADAARLQHLLNKGRISENSVSGAGTMHHFRHLIDNAAVVGLTGSVQAIIAFVREQMYKSKLQGVLRHLQQSIEDGRSPKRHGEREKTVTFYGGGNSFRAHHGIPAGKSDDSIRYAPTGSAMDR